MLSDLLTSSRGPGVIGTVLALVVLIGFYGLFVLVMENSDGPGIAHEIKKKEGRIQVLKGVVVEWQQKATLYKERRTQRQQLEALQRKLKRQQDRIKETEGSLEAAEKKHVALEGDFEEYKKRFRTAVRASAIGEEMPQLKTTDGKVYDNVKIRKVDAIGMNIQHKNGFTRIDYKFLSPQLQDRFQFSKEEARELTTKETKNVITSVQGGQHYKIARQILDLKTKVLAAKQKIAGLEAEVVKEEATIAANSKKITAARSESSYWRAKGNTGLNWDKAKKLSRRADSLTTQNGRLQGEVSKKRSIISKTRRDRSTFEATIRKLERELKQLKADKKP